MSGDDPRRHEVWAHLTETALVHRRTAESSSDSIVAAATLIAESLSNGRKVLLCGHGGAALAAKHIATEFVCGSNGAEGLAALALTSDAMADSGVGNGSAQGFEFRRQVEALARPGDVLIAMSANGWSEDVLLAVATGTRLGMGTVALTGADNSPLGEAVDVEIQVPSLDTQRIEEAYVAIGHVIRHLVQRWLAERSEKEVECLIGQVGG